MSGSEKRIKVSNIANYYENPRHPIASDEFDTLKKLFDSVGIPQMLNLASDIKLTDYFHVIGLSLFIANS